MAPQYVYRSCQVEDPIPVSCTSVSDQVYRGIDASCLRDTRTDRGLVTFANQPKYSLTLPRPKELPKGYIPYPATIGEHIRKRRLDLGLLQIEVAKMIGVTESTVWNWEHGTEPELRHIPKIIEFLGYIPFECPDDTIGKLRYFKLVNGLTYERLGKLMDKDPEQLTDWLSGRKRPCKRNQAMIESFLGAWLSFA